MTRGRHSPVWSRSARPSRDLLGEGRRTKTGAQAEDVAVGCAGDESLQEEPSAHADLLERLLQLRPVHRLSGAHPARPALPDPDLAVADHLGLLLAAVLSADRELLGRRVQENVSQRFPLLLAVSGSLHRHRLPHPFPLGVKMLLAGPGERERGDPSSFTT